MRVLHVVYEAAAVGGGGGGRGDGVFLFCFNWIVSKTGILIYIQIIKQYIKRYTYVIVEWKNFSLERENDCEYIVTTTKKIK